MRCNQLNVADITAWRMAKIRDRAVRSEQNRLAVCWIMRTFAHAYNHKRTHIVYSDI